MATFHSFTKLPLELRLAIWEMTVEPREVEVRIVMASPPDPYLVTRPHPNRWIYIDDERFREAMGNLPESTRKERKAKRKAREAFPPWRPYVHMVSSSIPAVLQTCREVRNYGLYQRISLDPDGLRGMEHPRYVWLNLAIDIVNIGTAFLNYFLPIAPSIKQLKLKRDIGDEWWYDYEHALLPSFTNVEKIYMACSDGFYYWGDEYARFPWPCPLENIVFIDHAYLGGRLEADYLEMERLQIEMVEGRLIGQPVERLA
ncbi:hypothetical protein FB567DRAFT_355281 [Paraphoma chrysanthemicola]|uniref:2EXR domain-containing protein n=1 Tax=Paraphoma chrysanthemicola TaxID=798071 RepID=A0A8K0R9E6_9PLEO|nr:hypothetical protein FB567DRAFT_355281 [Paraphoma chrysanthemicola]